MPIIMPEEHDDLSPEEPDPEDDSGWLPDGDDDDGDDNDDQVPTPRRRGRRDNPDRKAEPTRPNRNGRRKYHCCVSCGDGFTIRHSLRRHRNWHCKMLPQEHRRRHRCTDCGNKFSAPRSLRRHRNDGCKMLSTIERKMKKGAKNFAGRRNDPDQKAEPSSPDRNLRRKYHWCVSCGGRFTTQQSLRKHRDGCCKMLPQEHRRRYQCSDCKNTFSAPDSLGKHRNGRCKMLPTAGRQMKKAANNLVSHGADGLEKAPAGAHACRHCSRTFSKDGSKREHERRHRKIGVSKLAGPHSCAHCSRTFRLHPSKEAHERKHFNIVLPEEELLCFSCGKRLRSSSSLETHRRKHCKMIPREKYQCTSCGNSLSTPKSLEKHRNGSCKMLPQISRVKESQCFSCGYTFATSCSLSKHRDGHCKMMPRKKHKCPDCGNMFADLQSLRKHKNGRCKMLPREHRRRHQCSDCGNMYTAPHSLRRHRKGHCTMVPAAERQRKTKVKSVRIRGADGVKTGGGKPGSGDDVAREVSDSKSPGRRHIAVKARNVRARAMSKTSAGGTSGDDNSIDAPEDAVVDRPSATKRKRGVEGGTDSARRHGGVSERSPQCISCNKTFTTLYSLRRHRNGCCKFLLKVLPGPHNCRHCSRTFSLLPSKEEHEEEHRKINVWTEKAFPPCGQDFEGTLNLGAHEAKHRGERPFKCSYCERRFSRKCNQWEHEKRHTGIFFHKCRFCKKTSDAAWVIRVHEEETHAEEASDDHEANGAHADSVGEMGADVSEDPPLDGPPPSAAACGTEIESAGMSCSGDGDESAHGRSASVGANNVKMGTISETSDIQMAENGVSDDKGRVKVDIRGRMKQTSVVACGGGILSGVPGLGQNKNVAEKLVSMIQRIQSGPTE